MMLTSRQPDKLTGFPDLEELLMEPWTFYREPSQPALVEFTELPKRAKGRFGGSH